MKSRIASIDIFRALTMFLMIFVNDLWTLHDIPSWLEHTEAHEDGMGLADVVFPAFLFIVGLSVPFAIKARLNKGDSKGRILIHILIRSAALIVMGFYMVNQDSLTSGWSMGLRNLWQIFMIIGFFLIWNNYEGSRFRTLTITILQISGIIILITLAIVYKGGPLEDPHWMRPQWWGILGLIGWAYLVCSIIYLFSVNNSWIIPVAMLTFYLLNVLEFLPAAKSLPRPMILVGAANHALVMSGIFASTLYLMVRDSGNRYLFPMVLLIPAIILVIFGFAVRPQWGISKILASPSWTAICAGISFATFALVHLITDSAGYTRWANIFLPAGRSTLTCYLLPGLVYPFLWPAQQLLPDPLLTGIPGLIKSILFALLIIFLTGLLEKIHIKLKI